MDMDGVFFLFFCVFAVAVLEKERTKKKAHTQTHSHCHYLYGFFWPLLLRSPELIHSLISDLLCHPCFLISHYFCCECSKFACFFFLRTIR